MSAPNKPKKALIHTKPVLRQKRGLVELQLGHVIIGMIPATPSMHENHAFDHKKIVNIEFKKWGDLLRLVPLPVGGAKKRNIILLTI